MTHVRRGDFSPPNRLRLDVDSKFQQPVCRGVTVWTVESVSDKIVQFCCLPSKSFSSLELRTVLISFNPIASIRCTIIK